MTCTLPKIAWSVYGSHELPDAAYPLQGQERVKLLYAFRDIIEHGACFTLGSDAPVEDLNPLSGFFAAVTRLAPDGTSPHGPGGWYVTLVEPESQSC